MSKAVDGKIGLNLLSAKWIGKTEGWIVGLKVTILQFFVGDRGWLPAGQAGAPIA